MIFLSRTENRFEKLRIRPEDAPLPPMPTSERSWTLPVALFTLTKVTGPPWYWMFLRVDMRCEIRLWI